MKIAIDARWIFPEISGIGAYTRDLIKHIAATDKSDNEYILLFDNEEVRDRTFKDASLEESPRLSSLMIPFGLFSIANQLRLPYILKKNDVAVYHSTNYMIPLLAFPKRRMGPIKCVTTIHDVIPMIFPNHAPQSKKSRMFPLYKRIMIEVGLRSDLIITDSLASRDDVIKHLQIPEADQGKVVSVPCGVSQDFSPPATAARPETHSLLFVGRTDPYKNLSTLIKALAEVRNSSNIPATLTIAGSLDPRYPEPKQLAEDLGVSDAITWTGYLTNEELLNLYQQSTVLVHPSRYEGFGLQILEAMACGLPVICTDAGSQPEVAGDAAIIVNPDDVGRMAAEITSVLTNHDLAAEMAEKGIQQAAKFSWESTAKQTLLVYERACKPDNSVEESP
jgi:glycosyltransferase involved in cell wall biosynthesis